MNRIASAVFVICLLLLGGCGDERNRGSGPRESESQKKKPDGRINENRKRRVEPDVTLGNAVAEIEKLGGTVQIDETSLDKPVISVTLEHTRVSDTELEYLKALTQLQELHVGGAEITDVGLEHLKELTRLRKLQFGGAEKITAAGLRHIQGLTQLRELHFNVVSVTDAGLEHLKGLPQLQTLRLCSTQVTGPGLKHLDGLPQLDTLHLLFSPITDAGLEHLKGLPRLQSLNLYGTAITDAGVEDFQKALPKARIVR